MEVEVLLDGREVDRAEPIDYAAEVPAAAQVVNDAVGRFALWGFPDAPDRKLLPSGDQDK